MSPNLKPIYTVNRPNKPMTIRLAENEALRSVVAAAKVRRILYLRKTNV
jgi:hypothetical protein